MAYRRIAHLAVDRARRPRWPRPAGRRATARFYTLTSTAYGGGRAGRELCGRGRAGHGPGLRRPPAVRGAGRREPRGTSKSSNGGPAPLDEGIARVVAGDLAVLLGTNQVATVPLPTGFAPAYQVAIDVQRFESKPGSGVLVDAVWVVRRSAGGDPRMGRTVASETAGGEGFDALAAAHSRALAKVSGDIAAAIRAAAATKP